MKTGAKMTAAELATIARERAQGFNCLGKDLQTGKILFVKPRLITVNGYTLSRPERKEVLPTL